MWASTVSVMWVDVPSAAIRSNRATTSVRACRASVVADCETKSTRMEFPVAGSPTRPATTRPRRMSSLSAARSGSILIFTPAVWPTNSRSRAEGLTRPTGSLGLPASSPVTRMKRSGNTVARASMRRSPTMRRMLTLKIAITAGTIRRTRVMARPKEMTAMRQSTRNGPRTEPADSCSRREATEAHERPSVRGAEAHDLEELGQRARREEVAADQGEEEADDQGDAKGLLLVAGQRGQERTQPAHGRSGTDREEQHTPRRAPVRTEDEGGRSPDHQDADEPGDEDGQHFADDDPRRRYRGRGEPYQGAARPFEHQ